MVFKILPPVTEVAKGAKHLANVPANPGNVFYVKK